MKINVSVEHYQELTEEGDVEYARLVIHDDKKNLLASSNKCSPKGMKTLEYDGLLYVADQKNKVFVSWDSLIKKFHLTPEDVTREEESKPPE